MQESNLLRAQAQEARARAGQLHGEVLSEPQVSLPRMQMYEVPGPSSEPPRFVPMFQTVPGSNEPITAAGLHRALYEALNPPAGQAQAAVAQAAAAPGSPAAPGGVQPQAQAQGAGQAQPAPAAAQNATPAPQAQAQGAGPAQSAPAAANPSPPSPGQPAPWGIPPPHVQFPAVQPAQPQLPAQVGPGVLLPMFEKFDGSEDDAVQALHWITTVQRYWHFQLASPSYVG